MPVCSKMGHTVSKEDTSEVTEVKPVNEEIHSDRFKTLGRSPSEDVAEESEIIKPVPRKFEKRASQTSINIDLNLGINTGSLKSTKRNNFILDEEENATAIGKDKGNNGKGKKKLIRKSSKIAPSALEEALQETGHMSTIRPVTPPHDISTDGHISTTQLYNMMNDYDGSYIFDSAYMLIIDTQSAEAYQKSHIATALHVSALSDPSLVHPLNSYEVVVMYGDDISDEHNDNVISQFKNMNKLHSLSSSYGDFMKRYPCLCTNKVLTKSNTERRKHLVTYPSCILDDSLYQGTGKQANDAKTISDLQISHILNLGKEHPNGFPGKVEYLNVRLEDEKDVNLKGSFNDVVNFIDMALTSGGRLLVHCNLGISRSTTATLAYLMYAKHWSLKNAMEWVRERRSIVQPNPGFVKQLLKYEEELFGKSLSENSHIW